MAELEKLQAEGRRVFRSKNCRVFIASASCTLASYCKSSGWLISSSPGTARGESTPWFASFWEFCARYAKSGSLMIGTFPEQSLLISRKTQ